MFNRILLSFCFRNACGLSDIYYSSCVVILLMLKGKLVHMRAVMAWYGRLVPILTLTFRAVSTLDLMLQMPPRLVTVIIFGVFLSVA